ncbi:MAG TPA: Wzz/FepE/Etk N-terminal domain-containing protein [Blastocatellia bacterium]|nr:Wzz/FepE/Etk N-terminal domain-containing protein [Blastocatellia bacterium]
MKDSRDEANEQALRLDAYFAAVWRAKWLILALVLAAAGITAFLGYRQSPQHTATALLEVGRVWKEPLQDIYAATETINSDGFLQQLAEKTGARPGPLKRSVRAETVTVGPNRLRYPILVRIIATTANSAESVRLAQAVADELIARHEKLFQDALAPHLEHQRRLEERLKDPSVQSSRDLASRIESELDEVKAKNTSPVITRKTSLLEPVVPGGAIQPAVWRNVAAAALMAAFAGIAVAALAAHFQPARQSGHANAAKQ